MPLDPLTPEQQGRLRSEIVKADYDGMTADQAFTHLFGPRTATTTRPSGLKLTPVSTARILGAAKTEAIAAAVKQAYPVTAGILFTEGLDPLSQELQGFLAALVQANVITANDVALIQAAAVVTETKTLPPRSCEVFHGVAGFPNTVEPADFAAVFATR